MTDGRLIFLNNIYSFSRRFYPITNNGCLLSAINSRLTQDPLFSSAHRLSLDISFSFSSLCCKVNCFCGLALLALAYSLKSVLCCVLRCLMKLVVLMSVISFLLLTIKQHLHFALLVSSSLLILKYLQTADIFSVFPLYQSEFYSL